MRILRPNMRFAVFLLIAIVAAPMATATTVLTKGDFHNFDPKGKLTLVNSSLDQLAVCGKAVKLQPSSTIGSFTFGRYFQTVHKRRQLFVTVLGFTIQHAALTQLADLGTHFCVTSTVACMTNEFASTLPLSPSVPEPGVLGLLGAGLVGIAGLLRRFS